MGHLRKLGTKTHFAKLTHILPLKKAWGCCYKGLFLLSPSPPSSVDCVELKLEYITSTLHRGGRGEGRCLNLTSYRVSVPRVLTRTIYLGGLKYVSVNHGHLYDLRKPAMEIKDTYKSANLKKNKLYLLC